MEDEDEVRAEDNDDGFSPEAMKMGKKVRSRLPTSHQSGDRIRAVEAKGLATAAP